MALRPRMPPETLTELPRDLFTNAIGALSPYEAGASLAEIQQRSGSAHIAKLASNESPLGPTAAALSALHEQADGVALYPDGAARSLRRMLASSHGVPPEQILVGAGGDGCIDALVSAVIASGDELICGWPTFPTPVRSALRLGGTVTRVPLRDDHRHDLEGMLDAIGPATKLVYICHPNNPTATANTDAELDAYLAAVPAHVLTVLDQAYFEYVDEPWYPDGVDLLSRGARIAVVRTFSKIHGLAGLRVGYLLAPVAAVEAARKAQRAFEVSTVAQAAAEASLLESVEIGRRRELNAACRRDLIERLTRVGIRPEPGAVANFVFAKSPYDAKRFADDLLRRGIAIRSLSAFGAPDHVRITVGSERDHELLETAVLELSPMLERTP